MSEIQLMLLAVGLVVLFTYLLYTPVYLVLGEYFISMGIKVREMKEADLWVIRLISMAAAAFLGSMLIKLSVLILHLLVTAYLWTIK